jgi:2-phospho-L-lactate/phosphoenolpyruvate guanylyltransferase
MRTLAILPIKHFAQAKLRLAEELTASTRRALVEAMFSDVLLALRRSPAVDEILVITADRNAQRIAGGRGARVLDDHERGHNAAALIGIRAAVGDGIERALLVPGDCPMLEPAELDALVARPGPARSALIVPDRHGTGTNALLLTPPDVLQPSFGPGSAERHLTEARAKGIEAEIVEVPSLALDIDTPEDLAALEATLANMHGRAAHTRGMLRQLLRSRT